MDDGRIYRSCLWILDLVVIWIADRHTINLDCLKTFWMLSTCTFLAVICHNSCLQQNGHFFVAPEEDKRQKENGWQANGINTSCFLYKVSRWNPHNVPIFHSEYVLLWIVFTHLVPFLKHHPRGLVYSSVHHLGIQKYSSDFQFHCVDIQIKGFSACLPPLCVFMSVWAVWRLRAPGVWQAVTHCV